MADARLDVAVSSSRSGIVQKTDASPTSLLVCRPTSSERHDSGHGRPLSARAGLAGVAAAAGLALDLPAVPGASPWIIAACDKGSAVALVCLSCIKHTADVRREAGAAACTVIAGGTGAGASMAARAARPTSFLSCHRTSMWGPPVGGTFQFQIFIQASSPEIWRKTIFGGEGGAGAVSGVACFGLPPSEKIYRQPR